MTERRSLDDAAASMRLLVPCAASDLAHALRARLYESEEVSAPARRLADQGQPLQAAKELGYRAGWNDAVRALIRTLEGA